MSELILLLIVGAVALYWQSSMRAKEIAVEAAKRECKPCGVQLLDQTVHMNRVSMSRDDDGRWRLWRHYRFEYSDDGDNRLGGELVLLGPRLIRIALETFNNTIVH